MDHFLATILMFGGNFAPEDWEFCNGQIMAIQSNTALFSLLGTTYGGNGSSNFALPDMRGRVPMHPGQGPELANHVLGEKGGAEAVTLNLNQISGHTHAVIGSGPAGAYGNGKVLSDAASIYTDAAATKALGASAGGNQSHANLQPYLCVNFIICKTGIYPIRP